MAGDWIKIREDIHEDPAVIRMAARLNTRPEHVVGYCIRFWSWVSRNCCAGSVTDVTLTSLESVINLPGFCTLLCEVGWLEYAENDQKPVIKIPKFDRHLSKGAKARALAAERMRKVRVTKVSRSQRNKSATREEKRREEKNNTNTPPYPPEGGVEFPPNLQSTAFSEAWADWIRFRKEIRKPLTATSIKQQLKKLSEWGEVRAIASIEFTIGQTWQGLQEPTQNKSEQQQRKVPQARLVVTDGSDRESKRV